MTLSTIGRRNSESAIGGKLLYFIIQCQHVAFCFLSVVFIFFLVLFLFCFCFVFFVFFVYLSIVPKLTSLASARHLRLCVFLLVHILFDSP